MFVSSYSTYIDTTATKRVQNDREVASKKPTESFSSKLLETSKPEITQAQNRLPINYISNYKTLHNKQQLQEQTTQQQNFAQTKFTKVSAMVNAQISYSDNAKMFSLRPKPKVTIDQTPKPSKNLTPQAQAAQTQNLKLDMVNTYIANENYYRITAA